MAVGSSAPAKPWLPNLWLIRRAHHRGCSRRVRQISASTSADSFVGLVCGRRDRSARTVTLPAADVLRGGDTRWIHRAAHDLMGVNPDATKSMAGMPCGRSLYGSIPEQLADDTSCTRQLQSCGCARITASQPVSRSTSLTRSGGRPPQRLPAPISAAVAASRRVAEGVRDAAVESGEAAWVNRCRSSPRCSYISLKNTFTSSSRGRRH